MYYPLKTTEYVSQPTVLKSVSVTAHIPVPIGHKDNWLQPPDRLVQVGYECIRVRYCLLEQSYLFLLKSVANWLLIFFSQRQHQSNTNPLT